MELEAIFIAANVAEAKEVEGLLESEGIEYEIRPEAFTRGSLSTTCYQGLLFEVLGGQAEFCRRRLAEAGLGKGVVG